jgi:hypothetical protein
MSDGLGLNLVRTSALTGTFPAATKGLVTASALLLSAVTWALVRDMPVRNDTAYRRLEAADVRRRSRK